MIRITNISITQKSFLSSLCNGSLLTLPASTYPLPIPRQPLICFLSAYLFWSLSMLICVNSSFLFCWVAFHWIDILQLVYSFTCWWKFGLFSIWRLLQIKLLWTVVYKSLCILLLFLSTDIELEWLDNMIVVCLTF